MRASANVGKTLVLYRHGFAKPGSTRQVAADLSRNSARQEKVDVARHFGANPVYDAQVDLNLPMPLAESGAACACIMAAIRNAKRRELCQWTREGRRHSLESWSDGGPTMVFSSAWCSRPHCTSLRGQVRPHNLLRLNGQERADRHRVLRA